MNERSGGDGFIAARRRLLRAAIAGTGVGLLAGCDALSNNPRFIDLLSTAEPLNMRLQRALSGSRLAAEFPESMISPIFRPNGSINPQTPEYLALKADGFRSYRLQVAGRVERPLEFSLDALRALPTRTQVTRHDCVEGWSVIGQWSGVPLAHLLALARPQPGARYVVFHCFDDLTGDGSRYYESVDLVDAYHPQTIVAHSLNGSPVPVANGAPVRMRIERKLGYKQPKYVRMIEVVDTYHRFGAGRGGYWEDQGYDWWGGI
jgi:DMSO/TMAO reductase YedYZ molybdopterin-dependent catalytic subunit